VWVLSLAGVRDIALQSEYCAVLCRLWGHRQQGRDHAGLGSTSQRDRAPAGLCRTWEPGQQSGGRAEHLLLFLLGFKFFCLFFVNKIFIYTLYSEVDT
jgi:hypothetical protein